jgi:hypothetical protein
VQPLSPVHVPHLPRLVRAQDASEVERALGQVEAEAVKAGCSPGFVRGITGALARAVSGRESPEIYPAAAYYFIVREAFKGREKEITAQELAAAHRSGFLKKHLLSLSIAESP